MLYHRWIFDKFNAQIELFPLKRKRFFIIEISPSIHTIQWCMLYGRVWCKLALWKINFHESYAGIVSFHTKRTNSIEYEKWIRSDWLLWSGKREHFNHRWNKLFSLLIMFVCLDAYLLTYLINRLKILRIKFQILQNKWNIRVDLPSCCWHFMRYERVTNEQSRLFGWFILCFFMNTTFHMRIKFHT